MFICCKAPVGALRRATLNLSNCDNASHVPQRIGTPQFSTSTHLSTAHARRHASPAKERQRADRDQLTRLLKASPGKRDARNYLKQFDPPKPSKGQDGKPKPKAAHSQLGGTRTGVNLGNLYQPTVFTRDPLPEKKYEEEEKDEPLHLALVKLRQPQTLDDQTLGGIALTLCQMARLGLSTAVVLDCDENFTASPSKCGVKHEEIVREQAARFLAALEDYNEPGAVLVEHALSYASRAHDLPSTVQVRGGVEVKDNFLLYPPIEDGIIPVILPFAYDGELKRVRVDADDVLLALIREFAGISQASAALTSGVQGADEIDRPILDRIIILDPLGGIPSARRSDGAHVFVNLEAEYRDIKEELKQLSNASLKSTPDDQSQSLGSFNPISQFVEQEVAPIPGMDNQRIESSAPARHTKNLDVVQRGLKLLPSSSSGLIITPPEAATKAFPELGQKSPSKNPLLHNILTDKPMISSSLPTSPPNHFLASAAPNPATFLKRGVPLTMVPDPRVTGAWRPPSAAQPSIDLANDPRINFAKLEELINDSFGRRLHAKDYLNRIHGRVAGIIIAGDYEGGAICTWETPSSLLGSPIPSLASDTPDSPYWVPYLDKFAVLTSSQGSGGVSDIVWAALTRTCFPDGVVWRSRTSNPVNKWYQERSKGTWNLPGDQWTMFWTTNNITERWDKKRWVLPDAALEGDMTRWNAYTDVCKGITPNWADNSKVLD